MESSPEIPGLGNNHSKEDGRVLPESNGPKLQLEFFGHRQDMTGNANITRREASRPGPAAVAPHSKSQIPMISRAKDKMIGTAMKRLLEGKLARYGQIQSLHVDSKDSRMTLYFLPAGESEPVVSELEEYRILEAEEGVIFQLHRMTANRLWVTHLLEDFAEGLEVPVTGTAGKFAEWLL